MPPSFQIPNERRKDLRPCRSDRPKTEDRRHHHGASGRDGPLEPAVSDIDMKMQVEAIMRDGGMIRPSSILTRSPISWVPSACAAAIYLKHRPGEYENVRRLLGHRNIQTTINFYCGLETTQANETFGRIIRDQIRLDDAA